MQSGYESYQKIQIVNKKTRSDKLVLGEGQGETPEQQKKITQMGI